MRPEGSKKRYTLKEVKKSRHKGSKKKGYPKKVKTKKNRGKSKSKCAVVTRAPCMNFLR